MERKAELVAKIKEICSKNNVRPALYEALEPDHEGRIEITVACRIRLEDEHDDMIDELNGLTWNDKAFVVAPCGNVHFGGTPEQAGVKQIF